MPVVQKSTEVKLLYLAKTQNLCINLLCVQLLQIFCYHKLSHQLMANITDIFT